MKFPAVRDALVLSTALLATACGGDKSPPAGSAPGPAGTGPGASSGAAAAPSKAATPAASAIAMDGSSTVFPISEAVAEEFQKTNPARVTVGVSGTGGGFKKFCAGEIALAGASRPIKSSEVELCAKNGIEYIELPVAFDGIAIMVTPQNTWLNDITVADLKKIWAPEAQATVKKWSDVRAEWPAEDLHLFGAGVDSGTYDYFTQAIVGEEHKSRGDYTSSEDDNILVKGISGDKNALGFFGFAYYEENKGKLKLLPVDDGVAENGAGPIAPSLESIAGATYQPLSRPLFVYVGKKAAERAEVKAFVDFWMTKGGALAKEVGYVPLPDATMALVKARFDAGTVGSIFAGGGSKVGVTLDAILKGEAK